MKTLRNRVLMAVVALAAVFALAFGVAAQEGTFGLSEEDFAAWTQANGMSTMSAGNLGYDFTTTALINADGDTINMDLTGSGFITADGFTMNVTGNLTDGVEDIPAQLDVIVAGDVVYFNVGMGWIEGTEEALESTADAGIVPGVSSDLLDDPTSALPPEFMDAAMGLAAVDFTQYVNIARAGDAYTVSLLLEQLLADPAVQEALTSNPDTAQVAMMAPMVLGGSNFSATQTVGASGMVESTSLDITVGSADLGFDVDFNFTVNLDYEATTTIEAPADAVPLEDFISGLMGGM